MAKEILAWHILGKDAKLKFNDGRSPQINKWERGYERLFKTKTWVRDTRATALCTIGMHASRSLLDALMYGEMYSILETGCYICRVKLRGQIREGKDKLVGLERKIIWYIRLSACDARVLYNYAVSDNSERQRVLSYVQTLKKRNVPFKRKSPIRTYKKPRVRITRVRNYPKLDIFNRVQARLRWDRAQRNTRRK